MSRLPSPAAEPVVIGVDVGSSGVRALAVTADGREAAESRVRHEPGAFANRPEAGLHGLDPAVVRTEAVAALRAVSLELRGAAVQAISVTAVRQTLVLHKGGNVVAAFGNVTAVGPQWVRDDRPFAASMAAPRLAWLAHVRPDLFDRRDLALATLPGWLAGSLSGVYAEEPTSASTTGLVAPAAGGWTSQARSLAGELSFSLPPMTACGAAVGTLRLDAANALGLADTVPVVLAGGDAQMAAFTARLVNDQATVLCCGTHWQQLTAESSCAPEGLRMTSSHRAGETYRETVIYYPGETYAAAVAATPVSPEAVQLPDLLDLPDLPAALPDAQVFFRSTLEPAVPIDRGRPVLTWTGAPGADWAARLPAAVMLGAAFALDHVVRHAHDGVGRRSPLVVVGGAAASRTWLEVISAALDRPVAALPDVEAAAVGAALLGWQTSGSELTRAAARVRERAREVGADTATSGFVAGCRDDWAATRMLLRHWHGEGGTGRETSC